VHILQHKEIPPYVAIFRIHGPFLFGATDKIDEVIERIPELPSIIVLRLRNMTAIDATGLQALENLADAVHTSGRGFILCGAREQPAKLMHQAEFEEHVGAGNISPSIAVALERAKVLYQEIEQRNLHAVGEGAKG
jgi:SulP family sulfate permease